MMSNFFLPNTEVRRHNNAEEQLSWANVLLRHCASALNVNSLSRLYYLIYLPKEIRELYFSHPSESERIAKLEQIQKQKEFEEGE